MIFQDINNGFLIVLALFEFTIVCCSLMAYCYISFKIVQSHKHDKHYKRAPTVMWFNWFFAFLCGFFLSIVLNFFVEAFWVIDVFLTGLAIVAPITVWKYHQQIEIFKEQLVPNYVVEEEIRLAQKRWISNLEKSNLKNATVHTLINNLKGNA